MFGNVEYGVLIFKKLDDCYFLSNCIKSCDIMELPNEEAKKTCQLSERERRIRLKNQVLSEIVSSEEAYISQLDLLLNVG